MPKQQVTVSLFWNRGEQKSEKYDADLHAETDGLGLARFALPSPIPGNVKVAVELTLQGWLWGDAASPMVATEELSKEGIIEGRQLLGPKVSVAAKPWEIVVVARPTKIWERFLAHLRGS